jgi:hypothetical protein
MELKKYKGFRGGSPTPAKQATNSTSVSQPWAPAQPYVMAGMEGAATLASQGPQQYTPFSQVAGFDPMQQQAMNGITNYVNAPGTQQFMNTAGTSAQNLVNGGNSTVSNVANTGVGNTLGYITNNNMYDPAAANNQMAYGDNTNPYLKGNVDSALRDLSNKFQTQTLPGLRHQAIGDGSYGSSRNEMTEGQAGGDLAKQMYDTATGMYSNAFNTQEQNRLNALGISANQQGTQANFNNGLFQTGVGQTFDGRSIGLNNYNNAVMAPLQLLQAQGQVGLQQQNQNQANINDATNRWNFAQNAPWNQVQQFKNMVDPNTTLGGSGSGQSYSAQGVPNSNTAALATGGLLSAAGLAASFYGK